MGTRTTCSGCGAVQRYAICRCPNCSTAVPICATCPQGAVASEHAGVCGRCWSRGCRRAEPKCNGPERVFRAEPFEESK